MRIAGRVALNALLPPQCLRCRSVVDAPGRLCAECWQSMHFLGPPYCTICGYPFEFEPIGDGQEQMLCGACTRSPPAYNRARAVLRYDDGSRPLILGFKHSDRSHGAPAYGDWMVRAGIELVDDAEIVAPVPLHWTRLFSRRYNQSALLAQAVAKQAAVPIVLNLLVRRRRTRSQGHLSAPERVRNVRGAFAVHRRRSALVEDRRVLLVDDVLTTGATVEACVRALA